MTESSDQPTPSPTASPSDPGIPTAAREHSEEGAKAFASFYLEQTGRSWMVPNPSLLDGHATANCQTCANLQSIADSLLREEQRYLAAPIEVLGLTRFSGTTDKWVFDVKLRQVEVKVVDKVGKTVKTQHGRRLDRAVAVVWQGERWLVDGISE